MSNDYILAAAEFVRIRDLLHCAGRWSDCPVSRLELGEEFDQWIEETTPLVSRRECPDWLLSAHDSAETHEVSHWHLACQGVDRYMLMKSQGRQARKLGIPIDAGIHDKLDDGTDTLTPWKEGWNEQDKEEGNPPVFCRRKDGHLFEESGE